ncbi:L-valine transporter subunit YgaH, partial [Escherichia coli]|uniref:L-valine transporter subunit YgaH n=1 Tax=Escherichia coli TaxID=562 RepID=UPI00098B34BA
MLLGLLADAANYCFRSLQLRLRVGTARPTKRGSTGLLPDTTGIASPCALLVVPTPSEVIHDTRCFSPTLIGVPIIASSSHKSRILSIPTLPTALSYTF